jgi:hypothetical protein
MYAHAYKSAAMVKVNSLINRVNYSSTKKKAPALIPLAFVTAAGFCMQRRQEIRQKSKKQTIAGTQIARRPRFCNVCMCIFSHELENAHMYIDAHT